MMLVAPGQSPWIRDRRDWALHALCLAAVAAPLTLLSVTACARGSEVGEPSEPERLSAFVSIAPQAYFLERIAGDLLRVDVLVRPGQSPHTFEPTSKRMAALAASDVYFAQGLPFERGLVRRIASVNAELLIVDASFGIPRLGMDGEGGERHNEHRHPGESDPHIWLDPGRAAMEAINMADGLKVLLPAEEAAIAENLDCLLDDLESLDAELRDALEPLAGAPLFVYHGAFAYFADAYGLTQEAVQVGGNEPTARALAELVERARSAGVRVIFVQPQFAGQSARAVAEEIGGAVVPIDPLARDYLANMRGIAEAVRAAFRNTTQGVGS
jgi:zinc transport system substrate-binding protein